MTEESIKYQTNLQDFIIRLKDKRIEQILFDIDKEPTFDKTRLPFDFKYCYSINILTSSESFVIQTTMTESSLETFWIENNLNDHKLYDSSEQINLTLKSILTKTSVDNLTYKIELDFLSRKIFIYAAEIYDKFNGKVDCIINDEMILVFDNQKDSDEFERNINYG